MVGVGSLGILRKRSDELVIKLRNKETSLDDAIVERGEI